MKNFSRLVCVGIFTLWMAVVLQAQDATLEEVAANSADYYGQELSLEGTIENFLSPYVFVLGEDAILDNDQVLVINRSGQFFPINIMEGSRVTLTGTIYPSLTEWNNGTMVDSLTIDPQVGNDDYYGTIGMTSDDTTAGEANAEATDASLGGIMNTTDWGSFDLDTTSYYYNGWLARDYDNYTVMVVTSMDTISVSNDTE